jgi:hypothetical protein
MVMLSMVVSVAVVVVSAGVLVGLRVIVVAARTKAFVDVHVAGRMVFKLRARLRVGFAAVPMTRRLT